MSLTNYGEDEMLNAFTGTGTFYLALFTADPGETGDTTNEVSGGDYARQAVTWDTPDSGSVVNAAAVEFPVATNSWGTVSHWALMDASTGGNAWWYGSITTPKAITAGDIYRVPVGSLTLSIN